MKKFLLIIFLLNIVIFSQTKVRVTDYEVPVSEATTLRFDGAYNWMQTGDSVLSNSASANLLFRSFYSSLPVAYFLNIDAAGGKNFGEYTHDVRFDGSFRKYIWEENDWFGFATLIAQHAKSYKQIASDLTVGFGYGRYINATALAKAVRIEEHLIRDEVISRNLPKETMIEIANVIERESEYRDVYGEVFETYWLNDIEKLVKQTNLLTGEAIGSLGTLRMHQVLFSTVERVNQRYYGWDVSAGILFPLTTADYSPPGNPNLTFRARYSYPINWRLQINTDAEIFTPMDSSFFKNRSARIGADFIYELSNRINFVSGYRFLFNEVEPGSKYLNYRINRFHNLNISFWYYLENNVYLTLNGSWIKQEGSPKTFSTNIVLQYNIM